MRDQLHASGRVLAGALLIVCTSPALLAATATDSWDKPDSRWRQGPVKYLLSPEEDQAFKKFKTDEERKAFVDDFWVARDPSVGTPENEYRDGFFKRSREAAGRFSENGGKGWQDERGKAYILLGPPDESTETSRPGSSAGGGGGLSTSSDPFGSSGSGANVIEAARREVRFVYHADPFTGKKGRFELVFVSDASGGGGFQLVSPRVEWTTPTLRGLAPSPRKGSETTAAPDASTAAQVAAEIIAPPATPVVEMTPQAELMAALRSELPPEAIMPLDLTANFYMAADKSTFTTLTLGVKRSVIPASSDPDTLVIAAELLNPLTGESVQRFFKKDNFGTWEGNLSAGINDTLLYQTERAVEPGKYRAIFAMKDPASGAIGRLEQEIDVPSFKNAEFTLSTVTLARKLDPVASLPPGGASSFIRGNFRVVPRPDNVFSAGEELTFYYQIYNAAFDDVTTFARVDLSYAFEKQISGQWKTVGGAPVLSPGTTQLVQAFGLPLRGWPAGDYRVVVKVTDALAAKTAFAEVPFSILGAGPAGKAKAKSKG